MYGLKPVPFKDGALLFSGVVVDRVRSYFCSPARDGDYGQWRQVWLVRTWGYEARVPSCHRVVALSFLDKLLTPTVTAKSGSGSRAVECRTYGAHRHPPSVPSSSELG